MRKITHDRILKSLYNPPNAVLEASDNRQISPFRLPHYALFTHRSMSTPNNIHFPTTAEFFLISPEKRPVKTRLFYIRVAEKITVYKEFYMKKNIGIVVLALLLSTAAFAQTEADFSVEVTRDGKGVVIKGYNGSSTQVNIPATIQGMPVREIGRAAFFVTFGGSTITSVVIPQGVTSIGMSAFEMCGNLTSVTIPEGVTTIGSSAFQHCGRLRNITLPQSVTSIEQSAFQFCGSLTTINLPASLRQVGHFAFLECSGLTTVTIPESLKTVNWGGSGGSLYGAFAGCNKIPLATQAALRRLGYTGSFEPSGIG